MARSSRLQATSVGAITALLMLLPVAALFPAAASAATAAGEPQPAAMAGAPQPRVTAGERWPGVTDAEPRLSVTDDADRQLLILEVGPIPTGSTIERLAAAGQGLILHSFVIQQIGEEGAVEAGDWSAVVFIRVGGRNVELARLSGASAEVRLPRPLGFVVRAGDTLGLRVRYHDGGDVMNLRVAAGYEPLHGRVSRLGVVPVDPDWCPAAMIGAAAATGGAADAQPTGGPAGWTWEAAVSGRLLVLAGLAATAHGELVLTDLSSGAVLWRHVLQPPGSEGFAADDGVVRVGVAIEAGVSYHLSVTGPAADTLHGRPARAMVLPARVATTVALAH